MHTKDKLAAALREVGLDAMADKAATGYYHDFLSPLEAPAVMLSVHLSEEMGKATDPKQKDRIKELRDRHHNGDFDASLEESEEWAQGAEGQDAMQRLVKGE